MTAKQLIELLEKLPPNEKIYFQYLNTISELKDSKTVFIDKNGNLDPKGKKKVFVVTPFFVCDKQRDY